MPDPIQAAISRLHDQLPLRARQSELPPGLKNLHRLILRSLAERGRPPADDVLAGPVGNDGVTEAIQRLAKDDLVVLDAGGSRVVGAYPMTIEETPHRLEIGNIRVNAMCALDALSVSPMFETETRIDSSCHVTATPIHIRQRGLEILEARPSSTVTVGIRWQQPDECAAHSMCMEMVFLRDPDVARGWQDGDTDNISLFRLEEAAAFGAGFFRPLVVD